MAQEQNNGSDGAVVFAFIIIVLVLVAGLCAVTYNLGLAQGELEAIRPLRAEVERLKEKP